MYKKSIDKSEIALYSCFVKRFNARCFFTRIDCFNTYNVELNRKIRNLKLQHPGSTACFTLGLVWLARKTLMLESHFDLVGEKFVEYSIAVQNFRKFA